MSETVAGIGGTYMSKRMTAVAILLAMVCATAFAAERYFLVYKSARGSTFLDTSTAVLSEAMNPSDPRVLDCWLRSESAEAYELVHMLISEPDMEDGVMYSKQLEFRVYRNSGEQIDGKVFDGPKWNEIVREDAELTAYAAFNWAEKNLKAKPAPSSTPVKTKSAPSARQP
ncbi:MAG: hypothetical protein HY928_13680 [Elusimicrobia bacterium]|nr:hypothetical protein [Elusimicrobiota bacterium]